MLTHRRFTRLLQTSSTTTACIRQVRQSRQQVMSSFKVFQYVGAGGLPVRVVPMQVWLFGNGQLARQLSTSDPAAPRPTEDENRARKIKVL